LGNDAQKLHPSLSSTRLPPDTHHALITHAHHARTPRSLQKQPVPFSAGLLSYASWFTIPPGKKEYLVPNNCCYRGFQPLNTFAVRVHTHSLGRAVVMARPRANATGAAGWFGAVCFWVWVGWVSCACL
jgi:hypothetical protein